MSANLTQNKQFSRRLTMRGRIFKRGIVNFGRNLWLSLAACLVMTITLLTVFVAAASTVILHDTVENIKISKLNLSLLLRPETDPAVIEQLKQDLIDSEGGNVVDISISDNQKLASATLSEYSESERSLIGEDDIAKSFPVQMSIKVKNFDDIAKLKVVAQDDKYRGYMDENYHEKQFYNDNSETIIRTISNWATYAQIGGVVLGCIFLAVSILVIFNTIRMTIFARKDEVEMEKLIGAEPFYIRGPFLVEAELYGIIAGLAAFGSGLAILTAIMPYLRENVSVDLIETLAFTPWVLLVAFGMIVLGFIIGELSARLAIHRYLRY